MVLCYNKASKGARDLHRLAGRIGKQVQNLCGTAAVMVEPGPNLMSLHIVREDAGPGGDARAGRPPWDSYCRVRPDKPPLCPVQDPCCGRTKRWRGKQKCIVF